MISALAFVPPPDRFSPELKSKTELNPPARRTIQR